MRDPYICPYCDQRSTRWWNLKIHIKRRHGEYLPVGSSGQYTPNNTPWSKRNIQYHDFASATVADSIGDTFQPQYIPQQTSLGTSQYSASLTYRPLPTMDEQRCVSGVSHETIVKINELKGLLNKYPQYHPNPDGIIRWSSLNGDNTFLDDKLEQLRSIDSLANLRF